MTEFLSPASEAEAADIVRAAAADAAPIAIEGGGTRAGLGRPVQAARTLSLRGLAGITLYEPAELVIAARAGTSVAEVEAMLALRGQRLPFEPMDHRGLLGTEGEPTVGGVVAANVSGPRRIHAGAARDSTIGVRMVTGRGEAITSGGRVMKNVTGYDLVKLSCGAYGTLGVLTEVTFKVLPRAETEATLLFDGLSDAAAVSVLASALGSPFEVTAAAHLPVQDGGGPVTAMRLEGFSDQVLYRTDALARRLAAIGTPRVLERDASQALWRDIRDARPIAEPRERAIWRISTAPSRGPALVAAIGAAAKAWFYDWGGGLVWVATDPAGDAGLAAVRAAATAQGGHATLVRGPESLRASAEVFHPPGEAIMRLTRGLKSAFDPAGVLNPGRMYAGV